MRVLIPRLLVLLLAAATATPASAHGSRYRGSGPGDAPPPGLREPPDPTPPPPLPPDWMPIGPQVPIDDWFRWWQLNASRYEHLKWGLYHRMGGPSLLFVTDTGDEPRRLFETRLVEKAVAASARPAVRRVLDRETPADDHVRAAALLAYARLAREEAHVRRLVSEIAASGPASVREASVVALGLLRRSWSDDTFDGALLDDVRAVLRGILESPEQAPRRRGAAALAIGLLADQPTDVEGPGVRQLATSRLIQVVLDTGFNEEPATSALVALGHHAPADVGMGTLLLLRRLVSNGRLPDGRAHTWVVAEATRALGRLGNTNDGPGFVWHLPRGGEETRSARSAAMGLWLWTRRMEGEARSFGRTRLYAAAEGASDPLTRGLCLLGIADLLARSLDEDGILSEYDGLMADFLAERARDAARPERAYAILGLGVVARHVDDDAGDAAHAVRDEHGRLIQGLLVNKETPPRVRAAACIALGLGHHPRDAVRRLLADEKADPAVRACAAWGLGLPRWVDSTSRNLLATCMASGPLEIRRRAVRALALGGQPLLSVRPLEDAIDRLLQALETTESITERVALVTMLARFADHRAIPPLVALMEDEAAPSLLRALAASALGSIGDLQLEGSFDLLRRDALWWSRSTLLRDVYRYL